MNLNRSVYNFYLLLSFQRRACPFLSSKYLSHYKFSATVSEISSVGSFSAADWKAANFVWIISHLVVKSEIQLSSEESIMTYISKKKSIIGAKILRSLAFLLSPVKNFPVLLDTGVIVCLIFSIPGDVLGMILCYSWCPLSIASHFFVFSSDFIPAWLGYCCSSPEQPNKVSLFCTLHSCLSFWNCLWQPGWSCTMPLSFLCGLMVLLLTLLMLFLWGTASSLKQFFYLRQPSRTSRWTVVGVHWGLPPWNIFILMSLLLSKIVESPCKNLWSHMYMYMCICTYI